MSSTGGINDGRGIAGMPVTAVYDMIKECDVQSIRGLARQPEAGQLVSRAFNMLSSGELAHIIARSCDPANQAALRALVGSHLCHPRDGREDECAAVVRALRAQGDDDAAKVVAELVANHDVTLGTRERDNLPQLVALAQRLNQTLFAEVVVEGEAQSWGVTPDGTATCFGFGARDFLRSGAMVDLDFAAIANFKASHPEALNITIE